jgi:hypothetical protein
MQKREMSLDEKRLNVVDNNNFRTTRKEEVFLLSFISGCRSWTYLLLGFRFYPLLFLLFLFYLKMELGVVTADCHGVIKSVNQVGSAFGIEFMMNSLHSFFLSSPF